MAQPTILASIAIWIVSTSAEAVLSQAHCHLGLNNGSVTILRFDKFSWKSERLKPIILKENIENIKENGSPILNK